MGVRICSGNLTEEPMSFITVTRVWALWFGHRPEPITLFWILHFYQKFRNKFEWGRGYFLLYGSNLPMQYLLSLCSGLPNDLLEFFAMEAFVRSSSSLICRVAITTDSSKIRSLHFISCLYWWESRGRPFPNEVATVNYLTSRILIYSLENRNTYLRRLFTLFLCDRK